MNARSPLQVGSWVILLTLGFAAVVGLVAVIDADSAPEAAGMGFGVAAVVFAAGGTIACALSCLVRGKLAWPSVAALAVAGLALDLLVLAIWREIEAEGYGKVTGVAFVWTLLALLVFGLTIAVGEQRQVSRALYLAAIATDVVAGLIATWLIATAGEQSVLSDPVSALGDDGLLRALGAALVLAATLWFAALTASRLERASSGPSPDHGL